MRLQDGAFLVTAWAFVSAVSGLVRLDLPNAAAWAAIAIVAGGAARYWSAKYPGPMPYTLRWLLHLPRPGHSSRRLVRILEPRAGERILEIGPGIGIHALPVAATLGPGALEVLDIQHAMLGGLMRRAERRGIRNIVPTQGDAQELPFADHTFDGAYIMTALGEVPDANRALKELRRVLKPGGRLIIGEFFLDPDFVTPRALRRDLVRAGFAFRKQLGVMPVYLARFEIHQELARHIAQSNGQLWCAEQAAAADAGRAADRTTGAGGGGPRG
jgi:ubiquinone/menaquinone biosynthesis C-methylase UbiE